VVEIRWEEPRDLVQVALHFPAGGSVPALDSIRVLYWRRLWPETRWERRGSGVGWSGWQPLDDWYHGEWQDADTDARAAETALFFSFRPLAAREFPGLGGYSVTFRRTMKLRVVLPPGSPQPAQVQALVNVPLAEAEICIHWRAPHPGEGRLEGHNCQVLSLSPLPGEAQAEITGPASWIGPSLGYALRARVRYVARAGDDHPDRSILTVRCPGQGFSFLAEAVARGEVVQAPALGVTMWPASLGEEPPRPRAGGQSIYDRVAARPEQSYRRAMEAMPPRRPFYFVLGCEGARQKFRAEPDGDLLCPPNFVARVPGRDTPKLKGQGTACYRFGLEALPRVGRFLEDGYLPIIHAAWQKGSLRIEQTAFASPACESILAGPVRGDDPVAAHLRFRFVNGGEEPVAAELPVAAVRLIEAGDDPSQREIGEPLALRGGLALARGERPGEEWPRLILLCSDGTLSDSEGLLHYRVELTPGASAELVMKVPFLVLDGPELEALRPKDFASEHAEVRQFWRDRAREGCEIETPEQDLNDFYRAHLTHMLITNDREVGSDRIMTRVGSFSYGNFANESCMCISDLDRRGYPEVAERCLETFLHYQGTIGLSGDFARQEGQFYGSGGYEHGQYYVQHHGWVLWCLAQHYLYTRDADWLNRVGPKIVEGAEWIIAERQRTKLFGRDGRRVLEWGLLPAGGLEDVGDWYHWLSNNAFNWWGLHWAGAVLAEAGHPQGPRLVAEAEAYREDILAAFREASLRSPLVRLRDGSYVPHVPSRLYLRGRDFGWIRETLEGSIHLICTGLVDAHSQEATWIVKDFEDNRYLSSRYGYALEDEERWWFDRGGFSMQPNLLWGPIAYLLRDDIPHFLRAYFNSFAVTFRQDTRMCTEHPLPTLSDWAGDHFKTSDEAQSANWLRLMFVQEIGEELFLGRALPRQWLADGSRVAIRRATTHFGRMSMEIESAVGQGRITVRLDPPRRNAPSRIHLRLRHPEAAAIRAVEVDGSPRAEYEVAEEWIVFPAPRGPVTIVARY